VAQLPVARFGPAAKVILPLDLKTVKEGTVGKIAEWGGNETIHPFP